MDESTADVIFEVTDDGTLFPAHRVVLQFCAAGSTLAGLCEDSDDLTPVPITGVDSQVFRQLLYYVYGGNIDESEWDEQLKALIEAADRYGVKNLKIEAEAR